MNDLVELSKRFVVPMATRRARSITAPRMTMTPLPQWVVDGERTVDEARERGAEARTNVPQRMTMSKPAPVARTTIGRQR
jgi:hypothetical protein